MKKKKNSFSQKETDGNSEVSVTQWKNPYSQSGKTKRNIYCSKLISLQFPSICSRTLGVIFTQTQIAQHLCVWPCTVSELLLSVGGMEQVMRRKDAEAETLPLGYNFSKAASLQIRPLAATDGSRFKKKKNLTID